MTILVLSDTHGDIEPIQTLLERYKGKICAMIHLGDHATDMQSFVNDDSIEYHIVTGNNERPREELRDRVISVGGKQIFITHGHTYSVKSGLDKLMAKAKTHNVDACLFGHTHVAETFTEQGIVFLNPGSVTYPSPSTGMKKTYGLINICEDGELSCELLSL